MIIIISTCTTNKSLDIFFSLVLLAIYITLIWARYHRFLNHIPIAITIEYRLCYGKSCIINWLVFPYCRIYVMVKGVNIGSDNGLSPRRLQAIIWINADILLSRSQGTYFNEILFANQTFSSKEMFLYARLKNGRIMPWQCPSVRLSVCPSVRPGFPDFSSTCFEISIWNLVYTFSRWHDMSSLSCITIGSLWPSLQPKVGQTHFLQSWPHKSR